MIFGFTKPSPSRYKPFSQKESVYAEGFVFPLSSFDGLERPESLRKFAGKILNGRIQIGFFRSIINWNRERISYRGIELRISLILG